MTDDERLTEIKAREQAATKGPWNVYWYRPDAPGRKIVLDRGVIQVAIGTEDQPNICEIFAGKSDADEDAEYIAASRADIPYLLDLVDKLRAKLGEKP